MALRVRASFAKEMLEEVEADRRGAAIVAAIGADVVGRIKGETAMAWVEAADFERLLSACLEVGGDDALTEISRKHLLRFQRNPLFKNALDAVVRIIGLSPHTVLKLSPRARDSIVQDGGTLAYEKVDATTCRMHLRGFHPNNFAASLVNVRGTWLGALDLCHVSGDVVVDSRDAVRGDVDWTVRWSQ